MEFGINSPPRLNLLPDKSPNAMSGEDPAVRPSNAKTLAILPSIRETELWNTAASLVAKKVFGPAPLSTSEREKVAPREFSSAPDFDSIAKIQRHGPQE